jgi:class 3 adenylate cyclase
LELLYRRFGRRYFAAFALLELLAAVGICLCAIGLIALYQHMSFARLAEIAAIGGLFTLLGAMWAMWRVRGVAEPVISWSTTRTEADALAAWNSAIGLPLELLTRAGLGPLLVAAIPGSAFTIALLGLPLYDIAILLVVAGVALAYALVLHVFAAELALRPVLRDIASRLPGSLAGYRGHFSLRSKLLLALPLINVISGVAVGGISAGAHRSIQDLGLTVLIAIAIAITISFLLTVLVAESILGPVRELTRATERVATADLSGRVLVASGDELGTLGDSFNDMLTGLSEREALRHALGSYVHPQLVDRVVEEGIVLEGEEVDVTVLFIDLRDFTALAGTVDARTAVAHINSFFARVVPILSKHGGHADKFVGDGVLGVFGAPRRLPDHANRALLAACEIAELTDDDGTRWRLGIGVNSGKVLAGTIGGGDHYEFTVIGDAVNVAARLETLTRSTGATALLTDATRRRLRQPHRDLEPCGDVPIRGKDEPVSIYAPVGLGRSSPPSRRGVAPVAPSSRAGPKNSR